MRPQNEDNIEPSYSPGVFSPTQEREELRLMRLYVKNLYLLQRNEIIKDLKDNTNGDGMEEVTEEDIKNVFSGILEDMVSSGLFERSFERFKVTRMRHQINNDTSIHQDFEPNANQHSPK